MHTRAERKMLPSRQPARGAAARPASLEFMIILPTQRGEDTMICPYCNKQINNNSKFCPGCGQRVISNTNSSTSLERMHWEPAKEKGYDRNREYTQFTARAEQGIQNDKDRPPILIVILAILLAAVIVLSIVIVVTVIGSGSSDKSPNGNQSDSNAVVEIPPDALSWNGHHYACYNNCSSWDEAEKYCESLGGHLAIITSSDENNAVFQYLLSCGLDSGYIGFSDQIEEGNWYWVDGETYSYTNWHSGEPNSENSNEDYAMFYYKFADGTWNDGDFGNETVNDHAVFICEWD